MQALPTDILLQLPGPPVAIPPSGVRADAATSGSDAFAATLQLLLAGVPNGIPGAETLVPADMDALFASVEAGTDGGLGSALLASSPVASSLTTDPNRAVATGPADGAILSILMGTGTSPLELPSALAAADSDRVSVPADPAGSSAESTDAITTVTATLARSSGTELMTLLNLSRDPLPSTTVELPSKPLPNARDIAAGTPVGSQDSAGSLPGQTAVQFATIDLPPQPHGLIVTDTLTGQTDGESRPVIAKSAPDLDQTVLTSKTISVKPPTESVVEPINPPVPASGSGSSASPKSVIINTAIPVAAASAQQRSDVLLRAKVFDADDTPAVRAEAGTLSSKMADLGLRSLSIRSGNSQTFATERPEALSALDVSVTSRAASRETASIVARSVLPSHEQVNERAARSGGSDRKNGDLAAGSQTGRSGEMMPKEPVPVQNASAHSVLSSKEIAPERTELAPPARFVIEDPKPIRVPGQITLRMEPSDLGRLTIDLQTGPSGIIGRLRFASDAVRATVERDIAQLHRALTDAGIRVERLDIVGVAPGGERSSLWSQTHGDHQAPQRESQGRNGEPKNNLASNDHERGHRNQPQWIKQPQSPWLSMTNIAQGLNLVA
jgi:flagellar hook-length control protein FliK